MTMHSSPPTVLITGAAGFIAQHCSLQLLAQGYQVRGTLRSLDGASRLRETLARHGADTSRLSLVQADLLSDKGWREVVEGCDYVLHVASPFPNQPPKAENELIVPAREGTLRVLRTAADVGVKRVVLTSSMVAVTAGHPRSKQDFDETDWSRTDGSIGAYPKSKTLAERAAWDFVKQLGRTNTLELAVINPGLVMGPLPDASLRTSGEVIRKLMKREVPGVAHMRILPVDVRDVAAAHIAAMTTPAAAGQRFCCANAACWMQELALILDKHLRGRGYRIPTRELPNGLVRLVAVFDKTVRLVQDDLGRDYRVSTARIQQVLGWQPRSTEETVVAMAESMIQYKIA